MALEWITDPVSDDATCGIDLQRAADPEFMGYYFGAEARLPERYLLPALFDPSSIKIRQEEQQITALLKRSRDIRLLALLARFQILAGKQRGFADAVEAIANLMERWPDAAIPAMAEDRRARYEALETLESTPWVVMPIQYLPLTGNPEVTLRRYMVADGQASARDGEEGLNTHQMLDQLKGVGTRAYVEGLYRDLGRAWLALAKIGAVSAAHPTLPREVEFPRASAALEAVQDLIRTAFPDLPVWGAEGTIATPALAEAAAVPAADAAGPALAVLRPPPVVDAPPAGAISSQAEARVTLTAIENFMARHEPSSAALLLVTQARLLIGKPLVEAIETLLPAEAGKTTIDFGPATGFSLSMERLRALTGVTFAGENVASGIVAPPDPPAPKLASRGDVASHMRAVETWYRQFEPTSPIPVLLARARIWLDKDFEAILAEILPAAKAS